MKSRSQTAEEAESSAPALHRVPKQMVRLRSWLLYGVAGVGRKVPILRYRSPNLRTSPQEQPLTYATAKTLHHLFEPRSTYHATRSTSDRCAHFEIRRHWTAFRRSGSGRLWVRWAWAAALQTLVAGPSLLVRLICIGDWKSPPIACRRHTCAGGRTSPAQPPAAAQLDGSGEQVKRRSSQI